MAIKAFDIYYKLKIFLKNKFPRFYVFIRNCRWKMLFLSAIIQEKRTPKFYSQFISKGDLCFDIGANIGGKTGVFLQLGARVVAVEPQPIFRELIEKYGNNVNLTTVNKGVADKSGFLDLFICNQCHVISTMSDKWKKDGRFSSEYKQVDMVSVPVVTLDSLIGEYGLPKFCKIDVEGFEKEVLMGLTKPIPYISFEFTKEFLDDAKICAEHLASLGTAGFNFSIADKMNLFFKDWVSSSELLLKLEKIGNKDLWGDIYVKFI